MWLAELLGRERGEEVRLKNRSSTQWVCDPHVQVHFVGYFFLSLQLTKDPTLGTLSTQLFRLWHPYTMAFATCT